MKPTLIFCFPNIFPADVPDLQAQLEAKFPNHRIVVVEGCAHVEELGA